MLFSHWKRDWWQSVCFRGFVSSVWALSHSASRNWTSETNTSSFRSPFSSCQRNSLSITGSNRSNRRLQVRTNNTIIMAVHLYTFCYNWSVYCSLQHWIWFSRCYSVDLDVSRSVKCSTEEPVWSRTNARLLRCARGAAQLLGRERAEPVRQRRGGGMCARDAPPAAPRRVRATVCPPHLPWDRRSRIPAKPSQDDVLPWLYLSSRRHWETFSSFNSREIQWLRFLYVCLKPDEYVKLYFYYICRDWKQVTVEHLRDLRASHCPPYLQEKRWEKSRQRPDTLTDMMDGVSNDNSCWHVE